MYACNHMCLLAMFQPVCVAGPSYCHIHHEIEVKGTCAFAHAKSVPHCRRQKLCKLRCSPKIAAWIHHITCVAQDAKSN